MFGIPQIADLIATILRAFNLIHTAYNDPAMVAQKVDQMNQNLKDSVDKMETVLQDKNATEAQKQEALNQLRLADS